MFSHDTGIEDTDPKRIDRFLMWASERGIKKVRMIKSGIDISTYVPVFRTKQERDEYWDAYTQWYIQDGISAGVTDKTQKKEQQIKEHELLAKLKQCARRAYKWYVGGNNFCAEVFEIRPDDKRYPKDAGTWKTEIISNYVAELNSGTPLWHKKYPTARRVMSLRINDLVMAEFSKNDPNLPNGLKDAVAHQCAFEKKDVIEMVFRVKKINSSGTVYLRPHYIAREKADTQSWIASPSSLYAHKARKIQVSPTGKILK